MTPKSFLTHAIAYTGDECLLWPFSVNTRGYPQMWYLPDKTCREVHRLVCAAVYGTPASPMDASHSCGTPRCVSPVHVRWKTRSANLLEGVGKGETHHVTTLTVEQVRAIRADKRNRRLIAAEYRVHKDTITNIQKRRTWAHVP